MDPLKVIDINNIPVNPNERPLRSKSGGRSTAATIEFKSNYAKTNNFVTFTEQLPIRKIDGPYE